MNGRFLRFPQALIALLTRSNVLEVGPTDARASMNHNIVIRLDQIQGSEMAVT